MTAPTAAPSIMIDAMILIHACAVERGVIGPDHDHWQAHRDSHHLFRSASAISISAIAWTQIRRSNDALRALVVEQWESKLFIAGIDTRVANRAADLYVQVRKSIDVCPKCLGLLPPVPCSHCKAHRSTQRATDDILIAATADASYAVNTLYSLDAGMLYMNQFCPNVEIVKPPRAPAEPLSLPFPIPGKD